MDMCVLRGGGREEEEEEGRSCDWEWRGKAP